MTDHKIELRIISIKLIFFLNKRKKILSNSTMLNNYSNMLLNRSPF